MPSSLVRIFRTALYLTITLSLSGGLLGLSDWFLGTAFWSADVEYSRNFYVFAWLCYWFLPTGKTLKRWEWIAIPSLVSSVWLMVIAAVTDPEGIWIVLAVILLVVGLPFGLNGKYHQWANPKPSRQ